MGAQDGLGSWIQIRNFYVNKESWLFRYNLIKKVEIPPNKVSLLFCLYLIAIF